MPVDLAYGFVYEDWEEVRVKCFVYCEWIDDERLKKSMPEARLIDRVILPDHRLTFASFVEDSDATIRQGGCHLVPAVGESVPGLLYEFDAQEQKTAETLSRVPEGRYTALPCRVVDRAGVAHDATAYVIKHPMGPSKASTEYRTHMLDGARKHAFPNEYLQLLETI